MTATDEIAPARAFSLPDDYVKPEPRRLLKPMALVPGQRIDWFRVITDLQRSGMSLRKIGLAVGCNRQQIINQKAGRSAEPRFHLAMLLLGLWSETVHDERPIPHLSDMDAAELARHERAAATRRREACMR